MPRRRYTSWSVSSKARIMRLPSAIRGLNDESFHAAAGLPLLGANTCFARDCAGDELT